MAVLLREETQGDEGTEEAAPPRRVRAHGGDGSAACWAPTANGEASEWEEADARHPASKPLPPPAPNLRGIS